MSLQGHYVERLMQAFHCKVEAALAKDVSSRRRVTLKALNQIALSARLKESFYLTVPSLPWLHRVVVEHCSRE